MIRWLALALGALAIATASAVFAQASFVVTPQHADGLYRAGEKVVWTVQPAETSTTATATYVIRRNGTPQILRQGTLEFSGSAAVIESTLDEPGSLVLEVSLPARTPPATETAAPEPAPKSSGNRAARDGAIVDAEHLRPALARPEDFDAWWSGKLAELHAIPANPQLEPVAVDVPGIEYFRISLDNINGTHVRGQLARPATPGKFPALLQLQYAGVYPLQRGWVTERAKAGWLALNVLAHDMPIDDREEIQRIGNGALKNYHAIGNTDREQSYFLRMYLGDCRALEYLASREDWDGRTLVVIGDSMGGQQSFATVGLVGEKLHVTAMIVHVPSGADVGARQLGRTMAYPNWPNRPEVIATARYFDPVNFASRIKAPTLVSVGLFDGTSPPTGVIAAFNLLAGPKELLPMHSDHGGPGQQPRMVRREAWLAALAKGEAPPAPVPPKT